MGEFDDLQTIERRLMEGPYIHHFAEICGDVTRDRKEFCKYFPCLSLDPMVE